MNEDPESCYHYSKKVPPDRPVPIMGSAHNEILNKRPLASLMADSWKKHYSLGNKNNANLQRILPPVPKFEETTKKTKLNIEENSSSSSSQSANPYGITLTEGSYDRTIDINVSNPSDKVNLITVIQKPSRIEEASSSLNSNSKSRQKYLEKCELREAREDALNRTQELGKSLDGSLQNLEFCSEAKPVLNISSSSQQLDKKDSKKLEKFLECLNDYLKKLDISNTAVSEKFKELAITVIPQLQTQFKSKPFEAVAAAILLYSCREVEFPITIKQIVSASDTKEKLINKCIFSLKEILPKDVEAKHFKAGEFINNLCAKLKLSEEIRKRALTIWENIERLNFTKSIHAVTLAACCLQFACCSNEEDNKYFEANALAAGITKMTLKSMYRELYPFRHYFVTVDCMQKNMQDIRKL